MLGGEERLVKQPTPLDESYEMQKCLKSENAGRASQQTCVSVREG